MLHVGPATDDLICTLFSYWIPALHPPWVQDSLSFLLWEEHSTLEESYYTPWWNYSEDIHWNNVLGQTQNPESLSIPWADTHHGYTGFYGPWYHFNPVTFLRSFSCLGLSDLSMNYGRGKRMFSRQSDLNNYLRLPFCSGVLEERYRMTRFINKSQRSQGPRERHAEATSESPWGRGERGWEVLASLPHYGYHCGLIILTIDCIVCTIVILSLILRMDVGVG